MSHKALSENLLIWAIVLHDPIKRILMSDNLHHEHNEQKGDCKTMSDWTRR